MEYRRSEELEVRTTSTRNHSMRNRYSSLQSLFSSKGLLTAVLQRMTLATQVKKPWQNTSQDQERLLQHRAIDEKQEEHKAKPLTMSTFPPK